MKSGAKDEVKSRTKTKERLRKPMADPTLEGKDENKVGRTQKKIHPVDWESLLAGVFGGKTAVKCGTNRSSSGKDSLLNVVLHDWNRSWVLVAI